MYKRIMIMIMSLALLSSMCVFAVDSEAESGLTVSGYATGLIPMTEEERQEFISKTKRVEDVVLNDIALERIEEEQGVSLNDVGIMERGREVLANDQSVADTLLTVSDLVTNSAQNTSQSVVSLPSGVNNEESLRFPVIGNQYQVGSCTAFATAYYQLTNNLNLVRGTNARVSGSGNISANVMSPTFIYNLINHGSDNGSSMGDAFGIFQRMGAAPLLKAPIIPVTNSSGTTTYNYISWHPEVDIWDAAEYNRIDAVYYVDVSQTQQIKGLLANGYVLTLSTLSSGWRIAYPTQPGEYVCYSVAEPTGTSADGYHAVTVVGYNDTIWFDIDGDNIQDANEIGAYKIANSWGTDASNHNDGFLWVLYSAMSQFCCEDLLYHIVPRESYTPLLSVDVDFNTRARGQMTVSFGMSDTTKTTPEVTISVLSSSQGNYESSNSVIEYPFWGLAFCNSGYNSQYPLENQRNLAGVSGLAQHTVRFDLTPLIKAYDNAYGHNVDLANTNYRFYVIVEDTIDDDYGTQITELTAINHITGQETVQSVNYTANGDTKMNYVECNLSNVIREDEDFYAVFSYPVKASSIVNSNFRIKNSNGTVIDGVSVQPVVADSQKVKVLPFENSVTNLNTDLYLLEVLPDFQAISGNHFPDTGELPFYVLTYN